MTVKYIAKDGKEFSDIRECEEYETTLGAMELARTALEGILGVIPNDAEYANVETLVGSGRIDKEALSTAKAALAVLKHRTSYKDSNQ